MAGAPGACGSLVIFSSSGEIGSQSSARTGDAQAQKTNAINIPRIDLGSRAGMRTLSFALSSLMTPSMADAVAHVETAPRGTIHR
jgi:hypothetical protein